MSDVSDKARRLPAAVKRLGWVSFFTDVAADMISVLLPLFLVGSLGASYSFVGVIDGAAESISSFLKIASGKWVDRSRAHKKLTLLGYGIAGIARPLIAIATAPWHVLLIRVGDRVGKGIRTAPRDAWIAEVSAPTDRARAFGFHRTMDNAGSFIGPMVGLLLYRGFDLPLRTVFGLAAVPGFFAIALLVWGLRDAKVSEVNAEVREEPPPAEGAKEKMPRSLRAFFVVLFLFTLSNASDFFIILRAKEAGLDDTWILIVWTAFAGLRALVTTPGSLLSDKIGRKPTLLLGWILYGAVYVGFAYCQAPWQFIALLAAYSGFYGLTEGAERALVADLAPRARRGAAFGFFHAVVGFAALPASYFFGRIADATSLSRAFLVAGGIALAASVLLTVLVRNERLQRS